jgi:hypothetical protein
MLCVAAFIVLLICVLAVPIIRLFNKKTGDKIWHLFKKSTYCVGRRVTLRTCDSSFKDDVKNGLLRRVVLRHPKWVKPLSVLIEIASVLIILITIWSLLVVAKSGVSLYVYGTCNVATPSACVLDSSEACSIDSVAPKLTEHPVDWTVNWFREFGEAIAAIPTRLKHWDAKEYTAADATYYNTYDKNKSDALDIFDPGCVVCQRSYRAQKASGFFDKYNVALLPYPIKNGSGGYKFANSYLIAQYIEATREVPLAGANLRGGVHPARSAEWLIVDRIYTGKNADGVENQNAFNLQYSDSQARQVLNAWLKDFGYTDAAVKQIQTAVDSNAVKQAINKNYQIVNQQIKTKKIPTTIYDGKRHDGEFKS